MEQNLTEEELSERIAIIKRFRELLEQQKTKFEQYLKVLELQEGKIEQEDTESILAHSELETQIVEGINSLQKVIIPMEKMYKKSAISTVNPDLHIPINRIQNDLSNLQNKVLKQNERNRILLKSHMIQLKQQINEYKNPYRNLTSVYFTKSNPGSRITIEI